MLVPEVEASMRGRAFIDTTSYRLCYVDTYVPVDTKRYAAVLKNLPSTPGRYRSTARRSVGALLLPGSKDVGTAPRATRADPPAPSCSIPSTDGGGPSRSENRSPSSDEIAPLPLK